MMMKHYQELTLLPQDEINLHFLWPKVFQQIHIGLVEMQNDQGRVPIGLSFPEYVICEKRSLLGSKLRLFAKEEAILTQLNVKKWLSRLSDYVHCTNIRPVPEKVLGYAIYQREQPKINKERLARRYSRRHNVDYDIALSRYDLMPHRSVSTPFIRLKSLSSGEAFCLWIKKIMISMPLNTSVSTSYSCYGLSGISSVPEFF